MFSWIRNLLIVASLGVVAACSGDDHDPTVADLTASDARLSILGEALDAAGLTATFQSPGNYTVFAPTNDAFAAALTELGLTKTQLFANKPLLTAVLQYHVLSTRVQRAGIPAGKAISPLSGGIFKIDPNGSALVITDGRNRRSNIIATDVAATNGVVHLVDKVLLPADKTIVQTAQALPQFSILVEAVLAANLQGALSGTGPLTVFAPTNDAFAALLTELGLTKTQLLANVPLLTRVLTYHVVNARALKADIVPGQAITSLQGQTLNVDATLKITDQRARMAQISSTDVLTSNGVIHVIDRVILPLPAENIVQTAQSLPQFSILVEAVVAADLQGALSASGPLTVFAPTNDAFAALLAELGVSKAALLADKPLLTKVLTYHVLNSRVLRAGVPVGAAIATLQGETFTVDATLAITDRRGRKSNITATDIFTSNGVIHVIDKVILPAP